MYSFLHKAQDCSAHPNTAEYTQIKYTQVLDGKKNDDFMQ